MNLLSRSLFFLLPALFCLGVYSGRHRESPPLAASGPRARILALEGFFPDALVQRIRLRTGISFDVESVPSQGELMARLEAHSQLYDAVTLFHWQLPRAARHVSKIDRNGRLKDDLSNVSPDFRDLAPVGSRDVATPLAWGAIGLARSRRPGGGREAPSAIQMSHGEAAFWLARQPQADDWSFDVPDEGGLLWTIGLAMGASARHRSEVETLLSYLLRKEGAAALAAATHSASTNRLTEALAIDARLKPSYLRSIPLTRLQRTVAPGDADAVFSVVRRIDP